MRRWVHLKAHREIKICVVSFKTKFCRRLWNCWNETYKFPAGPKQDFKDIPRFTYEILKDLNK